jgi:HK97 family phage major capsid protein
VSNPLSARTARRIAQDRVRLTMLDAAGVKPSDIGRVFNRAAPTAPPTPDDIERITVPESGPELEMMLGDGKTMAKVFTNKDTAAQFLSNYARVVLNKDQSIATQVREETQRVVADYLREQGAETDRIDMRSLPAQTTPGARSATYNPKAMGAKIDKEFADSSEFFHAISPGVMLNNDAAGQARLSRVRNAFSSNTPADGGFLIPETLRSELLRVSLETAIVRPRARVIPMETLRVPFPAIDSTSNVSSVYGGIVGYWTEEGAALTASQAAFNRVVLDAKKLTAYTEVPSELISDSLLSFQAFIDEIFPEALGFYEDIAFLKGSGVGEPLGMLNTSNPATISISAETNQPTATLVWENALKMYARMLPGSINRAVWIVSPDVFVELATMALNVGTGGSAVWLTQGTQGPTMTLLGRPVIMSEKTPGILGTRGDINFVDPSMYLIGDRMAMSAKSSTEYKFGNDLVAYRIIERVDGRPWLQSAITPQNSAPTMSAFIQLATR